MKQLGSKSHGFDEEKHVEAPDAHRLERAPTAALLKRSPSQIVLDEVRWRGVIIS